jgi:hypothetical protein
VVRKKDEMCLFCGTAPCTCTSQKAPRPAKKPPPKPVATVAVRHPGVIDPDTLKLAAAVNTLAMAGMLPASELARHADLITLATGRTPELDRQIQDWKMRNHVQQNR